MKRQKNKILLIVAFLWMAAAPLLAASPQKVTYQSADSLRIVSLLGEARALKTKPKSWMLWFGRKFVGKPYVGGTLDRAKEERLVVNTRELDCTTLVEMVTALSLCAERGEQDFHAFCDHLRKLRYMDGEVSYSKRKHYFTIWMEDNEKQGLTKTVESNPPFTATQVIDIHWMTNHVESYKMLAAHPEWVKEIRVMEQSVKGKRCRYIPKSAIRDNALFRETIHDGDILVMVTHKKGLDTIHIGIAAWHSDGLHLLNASSRYKRVVEDSVLLRQYMLRQPAQVGLRVCCLVSGK